MCVPFSQVIEPGFPDMGVLHWGRASYGVKVSTSVVSSIWSLEHNGQLQPLLLWDLLSSCSVFAGVMLPCFAPSCHLGYHLCIFLTLLLTLLPLVSSGPGEQEYLCHMFFTTLRFFRSGMFWALHGGICLQSFSPLCCALFFLGRLSSFLQFNLPLPLSSFFLCHAHCVPKLSAFLASFYFLLVLEPRLFFFESVLTMHYEKKRLTFSWMIPTGDNLPSAQHLSQTCTCSGVVQPVFTLACKHTLVCHVGCVFSRALTHPLACSLKV